MDDAILYDGSLTDILRELEKTMEKANLLALDLALRGLEDGAGEEGLSLDQVGVAEFSARTVEKIERLVHQASAA